MIIEIPTKDVFINKEYETTSKLILILFILFKFCNMELINGKCVITLIIISMKRIFFLIELIFRWPIIAFKALSTPCLRISRMPLLTRKGGVALFEERELEPANRRNVLCSQTELKLYHNIFVYIQIWILFKCHLTLMLLLQAKSTFCLTHMHFNNLFAVFAFFVCESPHGIVLEYLINISPVNLLLVFTAHFYKITLGRLL